MATKPIYYEGQEFHNPSDPSAPVLVYRAGKFLPKTADAKGAAPQQAFEDARTQVSDLDNLSKRVTWDNSGPVGNVLAHFPATNAYNLNRDLDTVKGRIGFDKLAQMRAQSPTGGALGSVSDQENKMLQGVLGSVDTGQSTDQLKTNLGRIKQHYLDTTPGLTPETAIDLTTGSTRSTIPKGSYYKDPQGNIRRNDNGDRGNPIIKPNNAAVRQTPSASTSAAPSGVIRYDAQGNRI